MSFALELVPKSRPNSSLRDLINDYQVNTRQKKKKKGKREKVAEQQPNEG